MLTGERWSDWYTISHPRAFGSGKLKRKGPIPTKYMPMQIVKTGFLMEWFGIDILGELPLRS